MGTPVNPPFSPREKEDSDTGARFWQQLICGNYGESFFVN